MTYDQLKDQISINDEKMRARARAMCRNKQLGDDIWHDAVLKLLTIYRDKDVADVNILGLFYSAITTSFIDMKRRDGSTDRCVDLKYAEDMIISGDFNIYNRFMILDIMNYIDTEINVDYRDIFLMSVFGLDNDTISENTGESKSNIRKIISRTRSKIKKEFKHEYKQSS